MAHEFSNVTLEAVHVPEQHRTLENDHTITTNELPGIVNLYAVFDGGRVLLDQIKAPVVFEAIERGKQDAQASDTGQTAAAQEQSGYRPEGNRPNGEPQTNPQG